MKVDIYACNITPDLGCGSWIFVRSGVDPHDIIPEQMLHGVSIDRELKGVKLGDEAFTEAGEAEKEIENSGFYVTKSNIEFRNS